MTTTDKIPDADAPSAPIRANGLPRKRLMVSVWCLPHEKEQLQALADAHRLSVSSYLRTLGLGHRPVSTLDAQAMQSLAKVNGDQGRLGGLLKHYLAQPNPDRQSVAPIVALLKQIKATQAQLEALARQLEGRA